MVVLKQTGDWVVVVYRTFPELAKQSGLLRGRALLLVDDQRHGCSGSEIGRDGLDTLLGGEEVRRSSPEIREGDEHFEDMVVCVEVLEPPFWLRGNDVPDAL